jgi:tensin
MINASTSEKFWYKPKMSRDRAIQLLKNATPGDFIVRDSKSYQGSYGLCVRVERHQVPRSVLDSLPPNSDESCQLVRHFLIEGSQKGVKVAGSDREPNFASLAALIHQHCHTPLSLPIKLNIPQYDITTTDPKSTNKQNNHNNIDQISTTLYYLHETDTEMLTGEAAIERCYEVYKSSSSSSSSGCSIHVKASSEGLLLTDSKLTKFFRKHYSSDSISYCGYYNGQSGTSTEQWTNQNASPEKIIGIVAKKSASNTCVLLKTDQTETSDSLIKYLSMIIQKNSLMDGTQNGIY